MCAICLDANEYEDNAIVFCDKCNVAVHQTCYGISKVPKGEWYCNVCTAGLDPKTLPCMLCSHTGGAYKRTQGKNEWVHAMCASWIPEIFVEDPDNLHVFNVSNMDKKRFKLKCSCCPAKGACVQCCYGRCAVAAHPSCVLNPKTGWTRRIIKDENDDMVWETFCKTHADAVKEPLKPRAKSKIAKDEYLQQMREKEKEREREVALATLEAAQQREAEAAEAAAYPNNMSMNNSSSGHGYGRRSSRGEYSQGYGGYGESDLAYSRGYGYSYGQQQQLREPPGYIHPEIAKLSEHMSRSLCADILAANEGADDISTVYGKRHTTPPVVVKADAGVTSSTLSSSFTTTGQTETVSTSTAPVSVPVPGLHNVNLTEWPGQTEGEAMDLAHFWNVAMVSYPEDHPPAWTELTLAPILTYLEQLKSLVAPGGPYGAVPPAEEDGFVPDVVFLQQLTEAIQALSSTKGLSYVFDIDRRLEFQQKALELATQLDGRPRKTISREIDFLTESIDEHVATVAGKNDNKNGNRTTAANNSASATHDSSSDNMFVTFDGESHRYLCEYQLSESPPPPDSNGNGCNANGSAVVASTANVGSKLSKMDMSQFLVGPRSLLPPPSSSTSSSTTTAKSINGSVNDTKAMPTCSLVKMTVLDDDAELCVPTLTAAAANSDSTNIDLCLRNIHPKSEDDIICRMIRSDIHALHSLIDALTGRLQSIIETEKFAEQSKAELAKRREWVEIENLYRRQRVWRLICRGTARGVRDQVGDFNKHALEIIPKSWQVQVTGRPSKESFSNGSSATVAGATAADGDDDAGDGGGDDDEEPVEDAVCMVCFDGLSVDGNAILFCDGCNASFHQVCYGVTEIPEGVFYCSRCEAVKGIVTELQRHEEDYVQYCSDEGHNSGSMLDSAQARAIVKCCACPNDHGGLKPTTDGRWIHLCCALWTNFTRPVVPNPNGIEVTQQVGDSEKPPLGNARGALIRNVADMAPIDLEQCGECMKPLELPVKLSSSPLPVVAGVTGPTPVGLAGLSTTGSSAALLQYHYQTQNLPQAPVSIGKPVPVCFAPASPSPTTSAPVTGIDIAVTATTAVSKVGSPGPTTPSTAAGPVASMQSQEVSALPAVTSEPLSVPVLVPDTCSICKHRGGYLTRCCGSDGGSDSGTACPVVFHPLCAWFEGCYVTTTVTDRTFEGRERQGQYPSGCVTEFYCNTHAAQPVETSISSSSSAITVKKNSSVESSAVMSDDVVTTTNALAADDADAVSSAREVQKQLRLKYHINELDLARIPGQHRFKRKKKRKQERPQNSGPGRPRGGRGGSRGRRGFGPDGLPLMRGSSSAMAMALMEPIQLPLPPDQYDNSFCAMCMMGLNINAVGCGGSSCSSVTAAASDENGSADATTTLTTEAVTGDSNSLSAAASTQVMDIIPPPAVASDAEVTAEVKAEPCMSDSVSGVMDIAETKSEGSNIEVVVTMSSGEKPSSGSLPATSPVVSVPIPEPEPLPRVSCVRCGLTVHLACLLAADPTLELPDHWQCPTCSDLPVASTIVSTGTVTGIGIADVEPMNVTTDVFDGAASTVLVADESNDAAAVNGIAAVSGSTALSMGPEPQCCMACPRRGGYFYKIWPDVPVPNGPPGAIEQIHHFCASYLPGGHSKINAKQGTVELRMLPKDSRKQRCSICDRKSGLVLRCQHLGCSTRFHAMCADRNSMGYLRVRNGIASAYCDEHVPEGICQLESGLWVDLLEARRFKATLETALMGLDLLVRRAKLKKQAMLCDGELYQLQFNRLLDRAMGRKSGAGNAEGSGQQSDADFMELFGDFNRVREEEEEEAARLAEEAQWALEEERRTARRGPGRPKLTDQLGAVESLVTTQGKPTGTAPSRPEFIIVEHEGQEFRISGKFSKRGKMHIPHNLYVHFCGQQMSIRDPLVSQAATLAVDSPAAITAFKQYAKAVHADVLAVQNMHRDAYGLVTDDRAFEQIGVSVGKELELALRQPQKTFLRAMKLHDIVPVFAKESAVSSSSSSSSSADKMTVDDGSGSGVASKPKSKLAPKVIKIAPYRSTVDIGKQTQEDPVLASLIQHRQGQGQRLTQAAEGQIQQQCMLNGQPVSLSTDGSSSSLSLSELVRQCVTRCTSDSSSTGDDGAVNAFTVYTPDKQYQLERRIQYVLNAIEAQLVPNNTGADGDYAEIDADADAEEGAVRVSVKKERSKGNQKGKGQKSNTEAKDVDMEIDAHADSTVTSNSNMNQTRHLIDDFAEVPYSVLPSYNLLVRHPRCMESLSEKLRTHQYFSYSQFVNDFAEMLNNGNSLSPVNSMVSA